MIYPEGWEEFSRSERRAWMIGEAKRLAFCDDRPTRAMINSMLHLSPEMWADLASDKEFIDRLIENEHLANTVGYGIGAGRSVAYPLIKVWGIRFLWFLVFVWIVFYVFIRDWEDKDKYDTYLNPDARKRAALSESRHQIVNPRMGAWELRNTAIEAILLYDFIEAYEEPTPEALKRFLVNKNLWKKKRKEFLEQVQNFLDHVAVEDPLIGMVYLSETPELKLIQYRLRKRPEFAPIGEYLSDVDRLIRAQKELKPKLSEKNYEKLRAETTKQRIEYDRLRRSIEAKNLEDMHTALMVLTGKWNREHHRSWSRFGKNNSLPYRTPMLPATTWTIDMRGPGAKFRLWLFVGKVEENGKFGGEIMYIRDDGRSGYEELEVGKCDYRDCRFSAELPFKLGRGQTYEMLTVFTANSVQPRKVVGTFERFPKTRAPAGEDSFTFEMNQHIDSMPK